MSIKEHNENCKRIIIKESEINVNMKTKTKNIYRIIKDNFINFSAM